MADEERNVREKLLEAGTEEFLKYGFRGASLRRICASAGVTTGALYFFFENKEDLFCRIVEKPLAIGRRLFEEKTQEEFEHPETAVDNEDQLIQLLMRYRRECILLMDKAEGTRYAHYREEYEKKLEATFLQFFDAYTAGRADPALVHLIMSMRLQGYLELIYRNPPMDEARKLVEGMAYYADAGFAALVKKINEEG